MSQHNSNLFNLLLKEKVSARVAEYSNKTEYTRGFSEGVSHIMSVISTTIGFPDDIEVTHTDERCSSCKFYNEAGNMICQKTHTYKNHDDKACAHHEDKDSEPPMVGEQVMVSDDGIVWYLKRYVGKHIVHDEGDETAVSEWENIIPFRLFSSQFINKQIPQIEDEPWRQERYLVD